MIFMSETAQAQKYGKKALKIVIALVAVVVVAALIWGGYTAWLWSKHKFHDLTITLGDPLPVAADYLTKYGDPDKARLITDDIPQDKPGVYEVTLRHGRQEETVSLTVVDKTPPVASFRDLTALTGQLPAAEDFVAEVFDHSPVTVSFARPLVQPEDYAPTPVEILIRDENGNETRGTATLTFIWLKESVALELGDTLEAEDILLDPKDKDLLDAAALEAVNASGVGEYEIQGQSGGGSCKCLVTVRDTTGPVLELKSHTEYQYESVKVEDFLVSATDLSGDVSLAFVETPDLSKAGTFAVQIKATDPLGNVTIATAELVVKPNTDPPTFSGMKAISTAKNTTPNYRAGVKAYDKRDGYVDFTYDASKVNLAKAGTYYVTYSAKDKDGNLGTYRRTVVVEHDQSDTDALVLEEIAKCGTSDPERIRDYVRKSIRYNTDWGGSDPVWYGFTQRKGNCYVHAQCLYVMLRHHGYQAQIIHTTDSSHYWVIVKINGVWWHIDATPSTAHSRYSLMNDDQRYETLQIGHTRDWDRSQWPACG